MVLKMIRIPAGPFQFGCEGELCDLPEFWVSKTPVTNAEYARFVVAAGFTPPKHWQGDRPPGHLEDHPVTHVSWHDALEFCQWAGKRLPAEEEWEKAARGSDGRQYPWGEWNEGYCNTKEMGIGSTTPVGAFSPSGDSPYGCADMAGNVLEWTASVDEKYRTIRGGSYNHDRELAPCTFRVRHKPSYRYRNIGFRVASDSEA
jgi:formylglycine-generating enzyme required for sulfatase activity